MWPVESGISLIRGLSLQEVASAGSRSELRDALLGGPGPGLILGSKRPQSGRARQLFVFCVRAFDPPVPRCADSVRAELTTTQTRARFRTRAIDELRTSHLPLGLRAGAVMSTIVRPARRPRTKQYSSGAAKD